MPWLLAALASAGSAIGGAAGAAGSALASGAGAAGGALAGLPSTIAGAASAVPSAVSSAAGAIPGALQSAAGGIGGAAKGMLGGQGLGGTLEASHLGSLGQAIPKGVELAGPSSTAGGGLMSSLVGGADQGLHVLNMMRQMGNATGTNQGGGGGGGIPSPLAQLAPHFANLLGGEGGAMPAFLQNMLGGQGQGVRISDPFASMMGGARKPVIGDSAGALSPNAPQQNKGIDIKLA